VETKRGLSKQNTATFLRDDSARECDNLLARPCVHLEFDARVHPVAWRNFCKTCTKKMMRQTPEKKVHADCHFRQATKEKLPSAAKFSAEKQVDCANFVFSVVWVVPAKTNRKSENIMKDTDAVGDLPQSQSHVTAPATPTRPNSIDVSPKHAIEGTSSKSNIDQEKT
jgi:hypothetical protein